MKKIYIKFGEDKVQIDSNVTLEDFLILQNVDARHIVTSINSDLIPKDQRKHFVLKEKDHINIFGPITGG